MPSGAELFIRSIQELGISRIFTLVGDHLNEVLAVAAREGVEILDMRHESGVTHAADAWARITRKPALSRCRRVPTAWSEARPRWSRNWKAGP